MHLQQINLTSFDTANPPKAERQKAHASGSRTSSLLLLSTLMPWPPAASTKHRDAQSISEARVRVQSRCKNWRSMRSLNRLGRPQPPKTPLERPDAQSSHQGLEMSAQRECHEPQILARSARWKAAKTERASQR